MVRSCSFLFPITSLLVIPISTTHTERFGSRRGLQEEEESEEVVINRQPQNSPSTVSGDNNLGKRFMTASS